MRLTLIDTSVWIEHIRGANLELIQLLSNHQVLIHPMIIGELACGNIPNRELFLSDLELLPQAREVSLKEVLEFIKRHQLYEKGLGWVDMNLMASALTSNAALLTYDKKLKNTFGRITS